MGVLPPTLLHELGWSVVKKTVLLFAISVTFLILSGPSARAVDVYAVGSCNFIIDSSCLVGGAGSDLIDSFESKLNATVINITGTGGSGDAWRVQLRKSSVSQLRGVAFYVKRTGDGSGSGTVSGGSSYVAVETSDTDFFEGSGDRTDITVQYKVSGISISVPPGNYSATIIFTVVDR